jgi:hypothetical protein
MAGTMSSLEFSFRRPDVVQKLGSINQRIVFGGIDQDGGTLAVLSENDGPLGALNLADYRGQVGPEIGQGADVFSRTDSGQ